MWECERMQTFVICQKNGNLNRCNHVSYNPCRKFMLMTESHYFSACVSLMLFFEFWIIWVNFGSCHCLTFLPVSSALAGPSGFFNLYLIDGVTGHIVFHENHKRTRGPVKVVHAENWVVVSICDMSKHEHACSWVHEVNKMCIHTFKGT